MPLTIAIAAPSSVPFQIGGAEKFWLGLRRALSEHSDNFVELIKLPCKENSFAEIVESYKNFSQLNLSHFDMLISSKYPAWMIRHHNHICYMQHTLRGLYDTYRFTALPETLASIPAPLKDLVRVMRKPMPDRNDLASVFEICQNIQNIKSLPSSLFSFPGPLIRELVHFFDRVALAPGQIRAYFAISKTVSMRKDYFPPEARIKILPHPSDIRDFQSGAGKYIFTASRINSMKRINLLVKAMRHVSANIPFKIAGCGPELDNLRQAAADDSRIEFLGHVPDSQLPELYANALFVPFAPYDEDYGLITIESMRSGKAVLTTRDSGGPCEFVKHGITGLCVEPDPAAMGKAMQQLLDNPDQTRKMGEEAKKSVEHINWPETVATLLTHATSAGNTEARPTITVCAHFQADSSGHGGQRRLYYLCRELSREYHVLLVCIGAKTLRTMRAQKFSEHFQQLELPWPEAAIAEAENLLQETGQSADDIAIMRHCENYELLASCLRANAQNSICAVVSHPYLHPAVKHALTRVPLIYDANNAEAELKANFFGNHPEIAREAAITERECCRDARLVLGCSEHDLDYFHNAFGTGRDKFRLLPNGCDCRAIPFASRTERARLRRRLAYPSAKIALFIGSGHRPNMEAARHIISMAPKVPEVEFLLAGSVSTQAEIRTMPKGDNVHLVGIISENVKKLLLKAADTGLNPITSGSGTNLKVLEYLASGLETVSTPFGMRGIDVNFAHTPRICEIEGFPTQIKAIMRQPAPDASLESAALAIAASYDWNKTMAPLCPAIKNIMQTEQ